jgi:ribosomal protein S3
MGQKINPNIFRLGIKKEWNSKYFEKNKEEFTLYNYQNVEIQNYLKEFFDKNNLTLQECKLHFNQKNLYIFISYYTTKKSIFLINKSLSDQFIKFKIINKKTASNKKIKTTKRLKNLKISNHFFQTNSQNKKLQFKIKRTTLFNQYKKFLQQNKYSNTKILNNNTFVKQLLESLSLFVNNKFHIFLTLQNINKGLTVKLTKNEQIFFKKKILFLKRYNKNPFFKESLNIILIITKIQNSAKLIANFISKQLNTLKKHNQFLIFLKRILTLFLNSKFSKIKGIKININGRLNGAPRSKNRVISIKNTPIQTINKPIDYSETTSFTKNGTFGIKIWIS